jgi:hypothetical protein
VLDEGNCESFKTSGCLVGSTHVIFRRCEMMNSISF